MVGVKGLKPSTSRSQTGRAINCATPRGVSLVIILYTRLYFQTFTVVVFLFKKSYHRISMKKPEKVFPWMLGVAALLAAAVSLFIGLQQSVWFDEAYSISVAEHSFGEIIRLTADDVHPPVYYWLLKAWTMLFGPSELALRSMSAVLLGLSIFVAGLLIRKLFGVKAAMTTLPFLVFAPFLLRYGFEVRMYALASCIGVSATYVLVLAVDEAKKRKRWLLFLAYALLVALGVYTLYFMALLWIAHLAWLAWLAYERRSLKVLYPGVSAYVLALLLFIPWLPVFLGTAGGGSLSPVTRQLDLENLYGMLTFLFLYRPSWEMLGMGILVVVLIVAMVGYIFYRALQNSRENERRYFFLFLAYFVVPVITLIIVTHVKPVYIERYVAHIAIGFYALLGVAVALALRKANIITYVATGGLVAVLCLGCFQLARAGNYNFQRLHKPSMGDVAMLLSDCRNDAVIFADGPQIAVELGYYVTDCPVYFFNETYEMGGGFAMLSKSPLRVADSAELPEADKILHVYYDEPKRTIPDAFSLKDTTAIDAVSVATYQTTSQ